MSLTSVTHTSVFLTLAAVSSVVTGIPSRVLRDTCDCPDDCDDEPDHPGCDGTPDGDCKQYQCLADPETMASTGEHESMEDLEVSVHSLRVMVAALLALVLILLLAVVLIFLKLYLPSFFKCFKKRSDPERRNSNTQNLRRRPSSTQNLRQLSVSTIRLANHQQSSESPPPARISRNVPHSTPVAEENKQQTAPPKKLIRQPSESTCPDESSDTHQGYDNLGLSTSTLHNQSTSSSNRSLGGVNNSTRTLNTILPPDNSPNESMSTRI